MGFVFPDGSVIPNNLLVLEETQDNASNKMFGIYDGFIKKVIYIDDPENRTGQLEYTVNIGGQDYPNALDVRLLGSIHGNHVRVRKGVEHFPMEPTGLEFPSEDRIFEEKKDGEFVWCMFIRGDLDTPLIIGSRPHAREHENPDFIPPTRDKGNFERFEFNGMEFMVDKEANLTITHVGLKDAKACGDYAATGSAVPKTSPFIKNPEAVSPNPSFIKFHKNGDFDFSIDDSLLKMQFIKADKKWLVTAGNGASVTLDGTSDKFDFITDGGLVVSIDGAADKFEAQTSDGARITAEAGKVEIDGTGGKLKLESAKCGIGGSAGELVEEIEKLCTQLDALCDGLSAETHNGNLGYPTGPPINLATYAGVKAQVAAIKVVITGIKGGI